MKTSEINTQCEKYLSILAQEYEQAKKDVQTAHSTFHYGLRDAMIARGYIVTSCGDNLICFYAASRLFQFIAHEGETWRSPWKLSDEVEITFSNHSWKKLYQYPCYYHDINYKKLKVDNFKPFYLSTCDNKVSLLEPYKTAKEKADTYNSFKVFYKGDSDRCLDTFDNSKDAIKFAYDYAQQKCSKGKETDLRRNYHCTPYDVTDKHVNYVAAYEYYLYDECSYYIYVEGEN
jgi:hypothetical protein